jgi:hypothetical protein
MQKIELIKPARLILICGAIAGAVAGCGSPPPSLGSNNQSSPGSGSAYASGGCFYSNGSAAERHVAGRVLNWCGPEPRPLN